MNKKAIIIIALVVALGAVAYLLLRGGGQSPLEQSITEALVQGDTTEARLNKLVEIIEADTVRYHDYYHDGAVDYEKLNELIAKIGGKMNPPREWDIMPLTLNDLSLKIYFERSGSMRPYCTTAGSGQLRKVVSDLINRFPDRDKVSLSVVNDDVYAYSKSLDTFLQDRDIYASTEGFGNAAFTDFQLIFNKILDRQGPRDVSVLVTDLIYDPKDTKNVNLDNILNEENSVAMSVFGKHKGKSMIVLRLTGDYIGAYYPYNNTSFDYRGKRPFFVLIMGDVQVIDALLANEKYASLLQLDGVTNAYRFNQPERSVAASFVNGWSDNKGRMRTSRDDAALLTNVENDRDGVLQLTLAVNFAPLHLPEELLTNVAAYSIQSQNDFTLSVRRINSEEVAGNFKPYLEGKTHLVTLTGSMGTGKDEVIVTLRNEYPSWVAGVSATTDVSPSAGFANTTRGLDRFLRGVFDATTSQSARYTTFSIKLQK